MRILLCVLLVSAWHLYAEENQDHPRRVKALELAKADVIEIYYWKSKGWGKKLYRTYEEELNKYQAQYHFTDAELNENWKARVKAREDIAKEK